MFSVVFHVVINKFGNMYVEPMATANFLVLVVLFLDSPEAK
jgi:hypothetical protein